MNQGNPLNELVIELLAGIDFDRRYYGYITGYLGDRKSLVRASVQEAQAFLSELGLESKHIKRENFLEHTRIHGRCELCLKVAFSPGRIELLMDIKKGQDEFSDTFAGLAKDVGESRDPNFAPSPEYPKLPFSNTEQMKECIRLGTSLFKDFERAFLSRLDCGA